MYPFLAAPFENIFKAFNIEPVRLLWLEQWDNALGGDAYIALVTVGRGLALISLFIALIQFFREASEESRSIDGRNRSVTEFIWPIIVIVLLNDNANFLIASTKAVRDVFNNVNDKAMGSTYSKIDGEKLITKFERAAQEGVAKEQMGAVVARCVGIPTPEEQQQCLENAGPSIDDIVAQYTDRFPGLFTGLGIDPLQNYADKLKQALAAAADRSDITVLNPFLTSDKEAEERRQQLTQQVGFQNLIELTFLLTGFLAPLAVGLSLLPVRAKPLYAWFSAFFAIGLTKIIFNFSLGVIAAFLLRAELIDSLLLTNIAGTFIPVASSGLFLILTTALYRVVDSIKVQP
jgi:hypothetical protein